MYNSHWSKYVEIWMNNILYATKMVWITTKIFCWQQYEQSNDDNLFKRRPLKVVVRNESVRASQDEYLCINGTKEPPNKPKNRRLENLVCAAHQILWTVFISIGVKTITNFEMIMMIWVNELKW